MTAAELFQHTRDELDLRSVTGFDRFGLAAGFAPMPGREKEDRTMHWLSLPPWVPLGLIGLYASWQGVALIIGLRSPPPADACRGCGYLLRHLPPQSDRCPECGRLIADTGRATASHPLFPSLTPPGGT